MRCGPGRPLHGLGRFTHAAFSARRGANTAASGFCLSARSVARYSPAARHASPCPESAWRSRSAGDVELALQARAQSFDERPHRIVARRVRGRAGFVTQARELGEIGVVGARLGPERVQRHRQRADAARREAGARRQQPHLGIGGSRAARHAPARPRPSDTAASAHASAGAPRRHRPPRPIGQRGAAIDGAQLAEHERNPRQQPRLVGRQPGGGLCQRPRRGARSPGAPAARAPACSARRSRGDPAVRRTGGQQRRGLRHIQRRLGLVQQQPDAKVLGRLRQRGLQRPARGPGVAEIELDLRPRDPGRRESRRADDRGLERARRSRQIAVARAGAPSAYSGCGSSVSAAAAAPSAASLPAASRSPACRRSSARAAPAITDAASGGAVGLTRARASAVSSDVSRP